MMDIAGFGFHASRRLLLLVVIGMSFSVPPAHAHDAAMLKARYADLREKMASNQFQRPLYLESSESTGQLKGDIYALVAQPYAIVGPALQGRDQWCDILILHQNVKSCRVSSATGGEALSLHIGRKFDRPLSDSYPFEFLYKVMAARADYLQVELNAVKGPLGTSNYRIVLEVVALDAGRSFLHMSYSYDYGMVASAAVQAYLATTGRDKLGFSIVGYKPDGEPIYLRGVRGVIERNTMRYYLAIEAYLAALSVPAPGQLDKRLSDWYAGVERYPLQLHELERSEYIDMKHREIARQQTPSPAAVIE